MVLCLQRLEETSREAPLIFFFFFFSLLASPKFLYRELAGGPPCTCCFNSATQNGSGSKQIASVERGEGGGEEQASESLQQLFSHSFLEMFPEPRQVCQEFALFFFSQRPCQHFSADTDLEV